jgi:DNA-directed RNA polymerase specialized sigma54-like protein
MPSRTQEYAVHYLHNTMKMDAATIAKELKIKQSDVENIIGKVVEESPKPKKISSKDLMISETSAKGTKNVSIMTQAASQMNDELVKHSSNQPPRQQPGIFRPKG